MAASPTARRLVGRPMRASGVRWEPVGGLWDSRTKLRLQDGLTGRRPFAITGAEPRFGGIGAARRLDLYLFPFAGRGVPTEAAWLLFITDASQPSRERERAELYYQAFLRSHTPMELTDRQGILVDVNPAFERVYGYRREELVGKKPNVVRSTHTEPSMVEGIWGAILDPERGHWSGELVNLDRAGREHPVRLTIDAIRNDQGEVTHFMGVATDLSEIRSLHLQAVRAERLASLGELAAGVAHEINTPLANVMIAAETLRRSSADPAVVARAETIATQVELANRIVRGLLDFARSRGPDPEDLDLVSVASEALAFVRGKKAAGIRVVQKHAHQPLSVRADRPQLLQVFVNIISNAYDAMGDRGTLTVRSGSGDGVAWVSVGDTGPGIPEELQPRLFEPFFTTKEEGKGTGLGLSICHGIVSGHGGRIRVDSREGHGATFTVELPLPPPSEETGLRHRRQPFSARASRGDRAHPRRRR